MSDTLAQEERVLELRTQGRAFGAIARAVGYEQGRQALEAFQRALQRRPPEERDRLCRQELARLEAFSRELRAQPGLTPDQLARKLEVVERLRRIVSPG